MSGLFPGYPQPISTTGTINIVYMKQAIQIGFILKVQTLFYLFVHNNAMWLQI